MSYHINVLDEAVRNQFFRRVLHTGTKSQLVVMSIPPGGEVGEEIHQHVEQSLFFQSGVGKVILDGEESAVSPGDVVVVTPGTRHNFVNTGTEVWKIITVYAPPNHLDGRIHQTKNDADADRTDEEFGEER